MIELGIPFSDPIADGPVIQNASYTSVCKGTNLKKVFGMMEEIRKEGVSVPVVFMMYYNTILSYGPDAFAEKCKTAGVDGVIVADLPFEEQGSLQAALKKADGAILIQSVSPVSKSRIPVILKNAAGFCCVSLMDAAGQEGGVCGDMRRYLSAVRAACDIPVIAEIGACAPHTPAPVRELTDGVTARSHQIRLLEQTGYDIGAVQKFCIDFRKKLQQEVGTEGCLEGA